MSAFLLRRVTRYNVSRGVGFASGQPDVSYTCSRDDRESVADVRGAYGGEQTAPPSFDVSFHERESRLRKVFNLHRLMIPSRESPGRVRTQNRPGTRQWKVFGNPKWKFRLIMHTDAACALEGRAAGPEGDGRLCRSA